MPSFRASFLSALPIVGLTLAACGEAGKTSPTPAPAAAAATVELAVQAPVPAGESVDLMRRLYPPDRQDLKEMARALEEVRRRRDTSLIPVLVELLRFMPTPALREQTGAVLRDLTGEDHDSGDAVRWAEWLGGRLDELRPPEGYVEWKTALLERISPRYGELLESAGATARIDLREVVWGAVVPDEIADLQNPPNVPATDADYLRDDERVFGVSIGGEHRAYPLRIANAHEMVNDVLGGEPIVLAY